MSIRVGFVIAVLLYAAPLPAAAFPWMVRHGYSSCAQCHADPSGGGVLTAYGRAQGEILLRTPWETRDEEWEPGGLAKFAFGVPLPDNVNLGFSQRSGQMAFRPEDAPEDDRFLVMQTEARAHIQLGQFRAGGSLGAGGSDRTAPVRVTSNDEEHALNVISRDHWVGWSPNDRVLVRAGRTFLPYGIRQPEHYFWAREGTGNDLNVGSQHGLSVSWSGQKLRAEGMAVLGNLSISPADYRERGFSGLAEWAIRPHYVVGVSTQFLAADADIAARVPVERSATGVFARLAPHDKVVVMVEIDGVSKTLEDRDPVNGAMTMLQFDIEPYQGIHLVLTGETWQPNSDSELDAAAGGWVSLVWYFAPHMDLRLDAMRRGFPVSEEETSHVNLYLAQLHFYL